MKNKITYIILSLMLACTTTAFAQHEMFYSFQYSPAISTGKLNDYIGEMSWGGVGFDYRGFTSPDLAWGVTFDWNVFYEHQPYGTYTEKTMSISGEQYRYVNTFPMLIAADYFTGERGDDNRYFGGLGIGTMYATKSTQMGVYEAYSDGWFFTLAPEVGTHVNIGRGTDMLIAAKYRYGFANKNFEALSYFALQVGFVFHGR